MVPKNLPKDINAEVILNYYSEESFRVMFKGMHKRNAYNDVLSIEESAQDMLLILGRKSIYNSLPEYIFHSIDRFDNIPENEYKERFAEEYSKQEKEKEDAYRFFAPIDIFLLQIRLRVRRELEKYTGENKIMQDIIGDSLTDEQRGNRFIKQAVPFLPLCKNIRGDKTLLTILLRKIFKEEGLDIRIVTEDKVFVDDDPRYSECVGHSLDSIYVGNEFSEDVCVYEIKYWSDEDCDQNFLVFVEEIKVFREFVQDFFMSVSSLLLFDISKESIPLRLSDTIIYNYLNYNTNI